MSQAKQNRKRPVIPAKSRKRPSETPQDWGERMKQSGRPPALIMLAQLMAVAQPDVAEMVEFALAGKIQRNFRDMSREQRRTYYRNPRFFWKELIEVLTAFENGGAGRSKSGALVRSRSPVSWVCVVVDRQVGRGVSRFVCDAVWRPAAGNSLPWSPGYGDDGGRRLAILSSFTETCRQFDVNPWTWLKETLDRLQATPADQLTSLLPHTAVE